MLSRLTLITVIVFLVIPVSFAENYQLLSPDTKIKVEISVTDRVQYSVSSQGKELIHPSPISLELEGGPVLGQQPEVLSTEQQTVHETVKPVIREKAGKIDAHYNELRIDFAGDYSLVFRAFDNGIAYRFEIRFSKTIRIKNEQVAFLFDPKSYVYFPEEKEFLSHNEREYKYLQLSSIDSGRFCSLPVLIETQDKSKVLITESDLSNYPGLWLQVDSQHTFTGIFSAVPTEEELIWDRTLKITRHADYIAETKGTRCFPWRIMAIAQKDTDLVTNQMVYLLASPCQLEDTSWIEPGKVAWDYWNALNIYGIDFEAGFNTETYKYFIDFAAQYDIEYILLDEGWYQDRNLLSVVPEIDMEELVQYGNRKGVGVILWVVWKTLDDQLETALDQFEKWGIKGIKVDYMQRDDQQMVNYYWKIAEKAAKHHLLVNFHGSYKPAGLRRAFPNVLTREGVRGMEHCKVADYITPGHNVTIPFIRMVAGPMDYTPGAMVNAQPENFRYILHRPMSMGTRCHQLAMYVVYESPLQSLADSPSNYQREPECMEFLSKVPSVWDETIVLDGTIGDYIVIARRRGKVWYIGAMTDESAREITLDLSFLGRGRYHLDSYQDGANAHRFGNDYKRIKTRVPRNRTLNIHLAPGGGWAGRIYR